MRRLPNHGHPTRSTRWPADGRVTSPRTRPPKRRTSSTASSWLPTTAKTVGPHELCPTPRTPAARHAPISSAASPEAYGPLWAGANGYLTKPFTQATLAAALREALA